MSPLEIAAIIALSGWAVYKQTIVTEVSMSRTRFKLAVIYAAAGVIVGGFDTPSGVAGWAMIAAGLSLSCVVGLLRGYRTKLWSADGKTWRQGTAFTVVLFVALIAVKFGLGTLAYFWDIDDGAGFGEVLVMIAIMMAVQAQIIYCRALRLPVSAAEPLLRAMPRPTP